VQTILGLKSEPKTGKEAMTANGWSACNFEQLFKAVKKNYPDEVKGWKLVDDGQRPKRYRLVRA
jgi:hypothetical protein